VRSYDPEVPLPDWLLWLLPVPLATLAAIGWASWSSRSRGPQRPEDSVQEFDRFRAAMRRSTGSSPGGRADDGGTLT
jgi:cytochrome c-type biogenesis protein CcmH/NrfF